MAALGNLASGESTPKKSSIMNGPAMHSPILKSTGKDSILFTAETKAIVWGLQSRAVQSMLDFDYVCERKNPSVVAMTYPMTGDHKQKFYWGHKEILIPGKENSRNSIAKWQFQEFHCQMTIPGIPLPVLKS